MRGATSWAASLVALMLAVLMLAPTLPARAQQDAEKAWADCGNPMQPPEPIIAACTAYIGSGNTAFRGYALGTRGQAYLVLDQLDAAMADFNAAIEDNPKLTFALVARARLFKKRGDRDLALADLNAATKASPDYDTAFNERGLAYLDAGEYDKAIADFDKAIELAKTTHLSEVFSAQTYADRAKAHAALGDADNANADLAEAHRIDPVKFPDAPVLAAAPAAAPASTPATPAETLPVEAEVPEPAPPLDLAVVARGVLIALAIVAGIGLAFFLLWLVAGRQKPVTGPHIIELPGNTLDAAERQFARILPMGVWATSGAQFFAGIPALWIVFGLVTLPFALVLIAILPLTGFASKTAPPAAVTPVDWTFILVQLLILPVLFLVLPLWGLLQASVPRGVSRVGALPLFLIAVLGLILTPIGLGVDLAANAAGDPVFFGLAGVAGVVAIIYAFGMFRGMLSIILARDKSVELMRATPSSKSFVRRVLAQMCGLPPLFEYATRPWPRYVVMVLASMCSGFFIALATIIVLVGTQTMVDTAAKLSRNCDQADCAAGLQTALLVSPLFIIALPLIFFLIGGLLQRAVQYLVRFSLQQLQRTDPRAPVLFLRAFNDDQVALSREKFSIFGRLLQLGRVQRNLDHLLLEEVTPYGPHVGLGNPKDPFPPYGAARGYFLHKDWKQAVAELALNARAIILCVDASDGVWWEVDHIGRCDYFGKTLFLMHPKYRAEPGNGGLMAKLAYGLGIGLDFADALAAAPPPDPKPNRPAATILGFFVTGEDKIQLIYSSTFSRLAYLLAVRLFIRSRVGLAPVPLTRPAHPPRRRPAVGSPVTAQQQTAT